MREFGMTIDGRTVQGENRLGVINPATGRSFAEVPDCSRAELDAAMEAARAAFPAWSRDEARRRTALKACAEALLARVDEVAPLLTREQGKPLAKARDEVTGAASWFRYTAKLEIPVEVVQDDETRRVEIRRRPLGVVAAITPWNYPLLLGVWKIAPSLLAGNTVVIKPSPYTPISTLALGEILRDLLPPGVLNVVSGGDELGAWMTHHAVPRKISFTGSVETGKKVAAAAAPDLKRVTLELGGNDPAIVLPDVDAAGIAPRIFWGAFENCGQICSAIKRVYVHESQYTAMVDALAEQAGRVRVGDGLAEGTRLGPINNEPQLRRVEELVEDARARGARVVTGGARLGGEGYFYPPTIVADLPDGSRLVDEEQFGPALPVIPYRELDEAIELANATHFGLSGSVWSADPARGAEVVARLECGTGWVNQHVAILPQLPFGGAKWSGLGVENGPWGLLGFTEIQVVHTAKVELPRAPASLEAPAVG